MNLLMFLLIGAAAGWLGGLVMKGRGFGLIGNIIVGIIGGVLGGWIFDFLDISAGGSMRSSLLVSFVGAVALLFIVGLIKGSNKKG
ncbi:MAG: GlsB/YeaQ/YmgE family stress response membrane protein [Bacteroidota bacterium]